ncbi:hypothetical protein B296_00041564 [Ensete ventricosum]|uniref:Uncharacterized protein n=1 Tax=Ensete ventricosum TaxID=4639 RepID=A0A426X070_ENSVE|nr:hypothetical protein B296_00041564 [Ensete ventricosum]
MRSSSDFKGLAESFFIRSNISFICMFMHSSLLRTTAPKIETKFIKRATFFLYSSQNLLYKGSLPSCSKFKTSTSASSNAIFSDLQHFSTHKSPASLSNL